MKIDDFKFAALAAVMAAAVTGATIVAATPAFGADVVVTGVTPTARVSYADLDLAKPAGIARLEHRVAAAADRLCVGIGIERLAARLDGLKCRDAAIAAAAPKIQRAVQRYATAQAAGGQAITLTFR